MVIVTSRLASRLEITAIFSSGISFNRFLTPYLLFSVVLSVCCFVLSGWIVPIANEKRIDFEYNYLKPKILFSETNIHLQVASDMYVYLNRFNETTKTGTLFTLEKMSRNRLSSKLSADSIKWLGEQYWKIYNYRLRVFEEEQSFQSGKEKIVSVNMSPEDFKYQFWLHKELTLSEFNHHIEELYRKGNGDVILFVTEKYSRYFYPLTILILTFSGVIVSYKRGRSSAVKISLGLILAFVFISLSQFGHILSESGSANPVLSFSVLNVFFIGTSFFISKFIE